MPKKQKKKKIKEKREKSNDSLQLRTRAPLSVRLFSVWHLLSVSIIFFLRLCFFYDSNRQSGNVTLFLFFFLFPYRSLFLSLSISLSVTLSLFHSFSVSDRFLGLFGCIFAFTIFIAIRDPYTVLFVLFSVLFFIMFTRVTAPSVRSIVLVSRVSAGEGPLRYLALLITILLEDYSEIFSELVQNI